MDWKSYQHATDAEYLIIWIYDLRINKNNIIKMIRVIAHTKTVITTSNHFTQKIQQILNQETKREKRIHLFYHTIQIHHLSLIIEADWWSFWWLCEYVNRWIRVSAFYLLYLFLLFYSILFCVCFVFFCFLFCWCVKMVTKMCRNIISSAVWLTYVSTWQLIYRMLWLMFGCLAQYSIICFSVLVGSIGRE